MFDNEIAAFVVANWDARLGYDVDNDTGQRQRCRSGYRRRRSGQRRQHYRAGFGLPPRIDERASRFTDYLVIPHPRFWVYRFANRPEQPQRRKIVFKRILIAPFYKCTYCSRRSVKNTDLMAFDLLPKPIKIGVIWRALVHKNG